MRAFELHTQPHRRKNILTGEWVLVSPQRTQRPWQGEISALAHDARPAYDPACYLCPGNKRANGEVNPMYEHTFAFTNDFPALLEGTPRGELKRSGLLVAKSERGICRVVNFSPRHDLTLAEMSEDEIEKVILTWRDEFIMLSSHPWINYVQIFENKGAIMGNSSPHPHCQIWAQESIPIEPMKELKQFTKYYSKKKRTLLADYIKTEEAASERMVYVNESFVILVPFWAVWPFETMIIPRRKMNTLCDLTGKERRALANALSVITVKYDNLFQTLFPYSAGIHQAPVDGDDHREFHFHIHFYPPLLRSASVKKFMVGYEMLAEPQRDITAEFSAKVLKELETVHFKKKNGKRG